MVADALGLEVGTPVVGLLRLRLLDGEPARLERGAFIERLGRLLFTDVNARTTRSPLVQTAS
ncbi:UTRA domain-containing protein [Kribbella sp.]|uniref:UTRA domain-containing protein n=1 Tax=Kribbella sp. TaxID=1871183 RepID=UPI002D436E43|nr:UTRA domain-containing protein [Kribbella sp.]HZX08240.1 UTRA domain-containing protein [Kribbella sp.]